MNARASLSEALGPELKPYLKYSAAAHLAMALLVWRMLAWQGSAAKPNVYAIDFVGGGTTMTTAGPAAPAAPAPAPAPEPAASRPPPQADVDEFGRRKRKRFSLPKPSLLRGWRQPKPEAAPAAPVAAPAASAGGEGAPGGSAEASADMPNFPYPWYIARVRQLLWQKWLERMPRAAGECVVMFSLMPDGSVVDVRTESTSGDSAFDLAALGSVQDAAPYPPLPSGFAEPFLKIHVTLRAQ